MTRYRRIRLGRGAQYRDGCLEQGFVGLDYDLNVDLHWQTIAAATELVTPGR